MLRSGGEGGGILGQFFHEISLQTVVDSNNSCSNELVFDKHSFILLGTILTEYKRTVRVCLVV